MMEAELGVGLVAPPRRRRSAAERRRIVEETLESGTSVARVAQKYGVNANQVFQWRRLYRDGHLGALPPSGMKLLQVSVVEEEAEKPALIAGTHGCSGSVHIELPGDVRTSFEGTVDPATLCAILQADLVLIGMPGIEKRIARFPQFYSRIGFVHEFRPLDAAQLQHLLESRWAPAGVKLPTEQLLPEVIASLTRMTGGNFRLLARLLTQIERVLDVNDLHSISDAVVEAARDSLVIGPA